jgi:hypothetical protein
MNIHPLWFICILVRISIIILVKYIYIKNNKLIKNLIILFLLSIGLGFIRKGYFGSNNEIQIRKVFWHDSRYIHGILYILSSIYLYNNNINISIILLILDIIFSILYRLTTNK